MTTLKVKPASEMPRVPSGRGRCVPAVLGRVFGGGALVVALALLLYIVAASLGEWLAGEPPALIVRLTTARLYEIAALSYGVCCAFLLVIETSAWGSR
jgi:hypothetical protein